MSAPSEAIRAGIVETRERITHDLDEIGERLNPHNIKQEIKEGIREATIGRVEDMARNAGERLNSASDGIVQKIKDNPVPAVIAGVGLAWLFMGSGSSSRPANGPSTIDKAREKVGDIAGSAQQAVTGAASPQIDNVRGAYQDNPIALAVGVFALGAVAGLIAPATRSESRLMGDVGERVVDKVTEVAREAGEKAQHVAERVVQETKTAVREEGLTSDGGQAAATI
ncbi:MAG TPA: DUF3618 domain-containing protein [Gemmatimonadaceae bacterium]